MKKGFRVFLWVGSILCTLLAIAFFTAGFLPGLLMLLCALLVNPLILERINRKKRASTALLIAGLLIASIAALSGADGETRGLETQADAGSVTRSVAADASLMSSTAQARNDEVQEETSASVAGIVAALPDENDDVSREKQIKTLWMIQSVPLERRRHDATAGESSRQKHWDRDRFMSRYRQPGRIRKRSDQRRSEHGLYLQRSIIKRPCPRRQGWERNNRMTRAT